MRSQAFFYGDAYVQTARDAYSPLMIAEFTLHHAKRNQIRLTQGTSSISETSSLDPWGIPAFWTWGGPYAFDGTETAVDGTFVVDYSDFMVASAGIRRYHHGMTDTRLGDPATLRAFKLIDLTTEPPTETVCVAVPQTADYSKISAYVDYSYAGPGYNNAPSVVRRPGFARPGDTERYLRLHRPLPGP